MSRQATRAQIAVKPCPAYDRSCSVYHTPMPVCQLTAGCAHGFTTVGAAYRRSALNRQVNLQISRPVCSAGDVLCPPTAIGRLDCPNGIIDMSNTLVILSPLAGTPIPGSRESLEVRP